MRKIVEVFLVILIFCFFINNIYGQESRKFYNGFGFEIGAGYNTLKTKVNYQPNQINLNDTVFVRNALWIQPSIKIYYSIRFGEKKYFRLYPFAGYYCFGGKSKTEPDGYKDIYSFKSLEIGIIPSFIIKNKFEVSPSIKAQYNYSVIGKFYGSLGQADSIPRKWKEEDFTNTYNNIAINAGIRAKYKICKNFSVGVETWFGLTNLMNMTGLNDKVTVTENNYRLFIGYEL